MKKYILIILTVMLVLPLAFAADIELSDVSCINATIDITAELPVHLGEYEIVNCSLIGSNRWYCDCIDINSFILRTLPTTVNTYNYSIDYYYLFDDNSGSGSNSRGSSRSSNQDDPDCDSSKNCTEWSQCVNGRYIRSCTSFNEDCEGSIFKEYKPCTYEQNKADFKDDSLRDNNNPQTYKSNQKGIVSSLDDPGSNNIVKIIIIIILSVIVIMSIVVTIIYFITRR